MYGITLLNSASAADDKISAIQSILLNDYDIWKPNFLNDLPIPLSLNKASDYNTIPNKLKHYFQDSNRKYQRINSKAVA